MGEKMVTTGTLTSVLPDRSRLGVSTT